MIARLAKRMRPAWHPEGGAALVTVLLFMVIVLILITSVLAVTGNEVRISGLHRDSVRAFELAQAGLQEGVRRIQSGVTFSEEDAGTDECPDGFDPSIPLATGESLEVGVCPRVPGDLLTVYEVQADARVGLAVRKLSVIVKVVVNDVPPEIVLSQDFGQGGSSGLTGGDNFTETFTIYANLPGASQRSFAGWFIQDTGSSRCYQWPCPDGLNLYPGMRRMLDDDDAGFSDLSDAGTCTGTVSGTRAEDPDQTAESFAQCGYDTDPDLVTYTLDSVASPDQTGGADFTNQLVSSGATSGTIPVAVAARPGGPGTFTEEESFAFTNAGAPSTSGRGGSYAVVVKVNNITGGGTAPTLSVRAVRVNSSGATQQQGNFSSEISLSDNTTYVFPLYENNLGPWQSGDRLKIVYKFKNSATNIKNITLEAGTVNAYVAAPFGTEQAKTDTHTSGLPYKYLPQTVTDPDTGTSQTLYFKYVKFDDWFETYYEFVETGDDPGWTKRDGSSGCTAVCLVADPTLEPDLQNNPQFMAIPGFPSDAFIQALVNQAAPANTATGGGTITSGSTIDFGCPPEGMLDPHTPGCNGEDGDYTFVALLDGDYHVNSNINGHGTIVVDGNLEVNGNLAYVGTVYITGNLSGNGNVVVTGGLVVKSTTDFTGDLEVRTGEDSGNLAVSNEVVITIGSMWER